jgi:glycosyltransferase involved in cell wall biosynthesis
MIASNILPISKNVKKGTELFVYLFIKNLIKLHPAIKITLFASGDSQVLAKLISINKTASFNDPKIGKQHHKIFELALLSKAFQQQDQFDLYHAHIGNGEVVLPFAPFVKKPIVFTLHGELNKIYKDKYYALFKNLKNIYFISVSQTQRHPLPELNYYKTIYHGVDTYEFTFKPDGSGSILWVGRGIPEKGLEEVVEAVEKTKRPCQIFAIKKPNHLPWLMKIKEKAENSDKKRLISFRFDLNRENLIKHYQQAKLFLFPVNWLGDD